MLISRFVERMSITFVLAFAIIFAVGGCEQSSSSRAGSEREQGSQSLLEPKNTEELSRLYEAAKKAEANGQLDEAAELGEQLLALAKVSLGEEDATVLGLL